MSSCSYSVLRLLAEGRSAPHRAAALALCEACRKPHGLLLGALLAADVDQDQNVPAQAFWPHSVPCQQVVFIHPNQLPGPPVKGIIPAAVDFLADTTRTVLSMVDTSYPVCIILCPALCVQLSSFAPV